MRILIFTILLLPLMTFAQEGGILQIGGTSVNYTSQLEAEGAILYYQDDTLVASEHGGISLVYENDKVVLEGHDTDGDGAPDTFLTLDQNEEIAEVEGLSADKFERVVTTDFDPGSSGIDSPSAAAQDADLVGSIDRITIPGGGLPWFVWLLVALLLAAGGGYWWYRTRKIEE